MPSAPTDSTQSKMSDDVDGSLKDVEGRVSEVPEGAGGDDVGRATLPLGDAALLRAYRAIIETSDPDSDAGGDGEPVGAEGESLGAGGGCGSREDARKLAVAVEAAVEALRGALRVFGREGELVMAFNGGKDATVCLHLMRIAKMLEAGFDGCEACSEGCEVLSGVPAVYFESRHEFPEVQTFMRRTTEELGLGLREMGPTKEGLQELVDSTPARAVVIGTRRDDPHGAKLEHFSPTTSGWPAIMRVNPIITWTYPMVWAFVRAVQMPYCSLYDQGYTSLGSVKNSTRNPALMKKDEETGEVTFRPAHELADPALERASRSVV